MNCPHCHTDNPPPARYCMACGTALPRPCAHCGAPLLVDARFCGHCGRPVAQDAPSAAPAVGEAQALPLVGERRVITALLADVKGSTALAERVDTETWVEIMNGVFHVLSAEIYRYGGEIDQYRGDGLVAFFGARAAHEDDPERALLAALAMQAAVQRHAAELAQEPGVELLLRIGVNTGEVVAAQVGDRRQHSEDTAMGRAIALAARMETAAEPGTVLVTEHTYRLVAPLFEWQSLGQITVKGVSRPISVYRPLRHNAGQGKARGIQGLESPLVGRDAELQTLADALERLAEGVGGIVTLVGEAGLGKSRLVAELRKLVFSTTSGQRLSAADETPHPRWIEGRCLSYATGVAYGLWIDMLRALLETAPDAALIDVRRRLREWMQVLCLEHFDEVYPYLGRMLSLPLEKEAAASLQGLEAEGLKVLTFRAVYTLVERVVQERPLVIVCEDLHWADQTSLELLETLLPLVERASLLVLCVLRPEQDHGCWRIREIADRHYPHRHSDLWLEPLSPSDSRELVRNLLRPLRELHEDLPYVLRARILERAEGNPFYVEEILRSLIDRGIVVCDERTGRWVARQHVDKVALPDTLQGVLRARIDRLPEEARHVLQVASVIGRIFSYPVLAAVAGREGLDTRLQTLLRAQLLRERARLPELEYAFKHQLTLEAAYNGLLARERRATHRRVAQALEELYAERLEEQLGLLAHHWERAGEVERALPYLRRAGERAADQFANAEAVAYLTQAIELVPEGDAAARYSLLLAREGVYDVQGAREAQSQDLAALEALADALAGAGGRPAKEQAEVAVRQARYAITVGDLYRAIQAAQKAVRLARAVQDPADEAAGYLQWGRALRRQSEYQAAGRRLEQALALAESKAIPQVAAASLRGLGLVHLNQDSYSQARIYFEQALHISRQIGLRRVESILLRDLGSVYMYVGDYRTAREHNTQALQICRQIGDRPEEGWTLLVLGAITTAQGDYTVGLDSYEGALRILNEIDDRQGEGVARLNLGVAYSHQGDYRTAGDCFEQAQRAFLEIGDRAMSGVAWIYLGLLAHLTGENESARAKIQRALRIALDLDDLATEGHALTVLGHALSAQGDLAQAAADYERALALLRESGQHYLVVEPLAGLARVALAREDRTQALAYAQEILDHLESHPGLEGADEPLRVYLTCYRVLRANGDPRAREVLQTAYRLLQERAAGIDDLALRHSYLECVSAHREIVAAWRRASR